MNNNIIKFFRTNINQKSGTVYSSGNYIINVEKEKFGITLKIVEKSNKHKSYTRLDKMVPLGKLEISNSFYLREFWLIITKIINICDSQFNLLKLENENLPSEFTVNLDKKQISIHSNHELQISEIELLIKNNNNKFKIFDIAFIDSLDSFINDWKENIANNASENEFRNILLNNARLFPSIFGIDDINNIFKTKFNKERNLQETKENKTDISNENFIIELKKPTTKIFNVSNSRNNIQGLSSELVSAANQLNLYCLKRDREKQLEIFNFTKGVLIIGNDNQFYDNNESINEKILSWNLFRQNYKFEILTFNDILKRIDNLKQSIIGLKDLINFNKQQINLNKNEEDNSGYDLN